MENEMLRSPDELKKFNLKPKGFRIYEVGNTSGGLPDYSRRDFYKICLHYGKSIIGYADKKK